jgi:hypothetical protein
MLIDQINVLERLLYLNQAPISSMFEVEENFQYIRGYKIKGRPILNILIVNDFSKYGMGMAMAFIGRPLPI